MNAELAHLPGSALVPAVAPQAQALKPWQMQRLDTLLAQLAPALDAWRSGASDKAVQALLVQCGDVSLTTAARWLRGLKRSGPSALADDYKGRTPKIEPWHPRARYYFKLPTKPGDADIASRLRQEGHGLHLKLSTFAKQITRLRLRTPASETELGRQANGWHHHWQNRTVYARRDWRHVPVGYRYEVDGHTCDFYIEHPANGGYFQPELTVWMDVRSRMVVGFWLGETENSADLRHSLSSTILRHNHVPAEIFLDHGAGKAETFTDAVSGYCSKLGIHPEFARARNARSKIIEAEFRRFEDRFGQFQPGYINNRTDDFFRDWATKWKKGQVPKMTLWQLLEELARYFDYRNREPMQVQGEWLVPAEMFSTLARNPALIEADAIDRPREERTVRRATVSIFKRDFHAPALAHAEGRKVLVEYDELALDHVWIYSLDGTFIGLADLIREQPGIAPNVVAERLARKEAGQLKRLEVRRADLLGKNRAPISAAETIAALEQSAPDVAPTPTATLLMQGHSLGVPPPPPKRTRTAAPVTPAGQQRVRALMAEQDAPTATPEQRFARALQLETQGCACDAEATWLRHYQSSAEYHSRRALHDEFNAL